jgi:hypothetical protein
MDEFSTSGRLFTLVTLIENYMCAEVAHIFGPLFPRLFFALFLTKMAFATVWPIFSQTHLVTQVKRYADDTFIEKKNYESNEYLT